MIPKMEEDLVNLQTILLQNFAILQSGVENFIDNNTKLLNVYLENVNNEKHSSTLLAFRDYMTGLFGTLLKTTDFIKEMMVIRAQNTSSVMGNGILSNDQKCLESSTASEATVTGKMNGFSSIEDHNNKVNGDSNSMQSNNCNGGPEKYKLPYSNMDISVYQPGVEIPKAHVTSIDPENLYFHICIPTSQDFEILLNLYNARGRQSYKCPPVAGIIFGMKVDDGIVRTVRCQPVSSGKVYLLDFGDTVDVDKNLKNIILLTDTEKNIPAQAILCKFVHGCEGSDQNDIEDQRDLLKKLLYQYASFRVINNDGNILHLELLAILSVQQNNEDQQNPVRSETSSPLSSYYDENSYTPKQLTAEELVMFNEEPPCTSNAVKAVVGFIPTDHQKICRFYDPKKGTCFKGNTCRQKHIPMPDNYNITKDSASANVYSNIPAMLPIQYDPNQVLRVTITHVTTLEYYYGVVLNTVNPNTPFVWNDQDILAEDYLKKNPHALDIVLAKFTDGLWYRAQIVEVDEIKNTIRVIYIDYGNTAIVPITNLARLSEYFARLPPLAQPLRLANVELLPDEDGAQIKGMGILCDMILNNDVNVNIVSHEPDHLIINFVDDPFSEIPQLLVNLHCVKLLN